jgi:hypothetical protein
VARVDHGAFKVVPRLLGVAPGTVKTRIRDGGATAWR